jgi:Arc/MetJ-type ribon-helix-helix transcriptional regulator
MLPLHMLDGMQKTAAAPRKQINLRLTDELVGMIDELRSQRRPIPKMAEVLREALEEKIKRELKPGAKR